MNTAIHIGFFGTPHLAADVLDDLLADNRFAVDFVVTNPDKPFGRHGELRQSDVKVVAQGAHIEVLQPEKIRWNEQFLNHIWSFWCDYFVVVAYGKILPIKLLEIPHKMCINVHGSILPRYRGASPIQSALLHGERETGVTIMQMSAGMDEGDILSITKIPVEDGETSATLFEKFAAISWRALIDTILTLEAGKITPLAQDASGATYCKKIEKEDGLIDWSRGAEDIYHMWQAYTPWPWIFTMFKWKRLILESVGYDAESSWSPWTVFRSDEWKISVSCGKWSLTLREVKLEWKRSGSIQDFLNGNRDFLEVKL